MLIKIISGGQTGADIAGLIVAKQFGLETGGWMPNGFKTTDGPKPEYAKLYGVTEHSSESYGPRTELNVRHSDGTMRLAFNFGSGGEVMTLCAITKYGKPHFDVLLSNPVEPRLVADWVRENNIRVLNIAGNAETTWPGTGEHVLAYLPKVLLELGLKQRQYL